MATIAYYIGEHRVLIDEEFLPLMEEYRWCVGSVGYVVRNIYKTHAQKNNDDYKNILLHRAIVGAEKGQCVDHRNGVRLDNRLKNLRICSHLENMRNQSNKKNSASKLKGVSQNKRSESRPWKAHIKAENKIIRLGVFESKEEAAKAYDEAAKLHFGEFAWLNYPEKEDEIEVLKTYYQAPFKSISASKYIGPTFDKRVPKNPWTSKIIVDKKRIYLGLHPTQESAARAYDKKSWELFKDKSKLNFPEEYENMM